MLRSLPVSLAIPAHTKNRGTALRCTLDARRPRPERSRTHACRLRRASSPRTTGRAEQGARDAATAGAARAAAALLDTRVRARGGEGWLLAPGAVEAAPSRTALSERAAAGRPGRPARSARLSPPQASPRSRAGRMRDLRGRVPDCALSPTSSDEPAAAAGCNDWVAGSETRTHVLPDRRHKLRPTGQKAK